MNIKKEDNIKSVLPGDYRAKKESLSNTKALLLCLLSLANCPWGEYTDQIVFSTSYRGTVDNTLSQKYSNFNIDSSVEKLFIYAG